MKFLFASVYLNIRFEFSAFRNDGFDDGEIMN